MSVSGLRRLRYIIWLMVTGDPLLKVDSELREFKPQSQGSTFRACLPLVVCYWLPTVELLAVSCMVRCRDLLNPRHPSKHRLHIDSAAICLKVALVPCRASKYIQYNFAWFVNCQNSSSVCHTTFGLQGHISPSRFFVLIVDITVCTETETYIAKCTCITILACVILNASHGENRLQETEN